MLLTGSVTATLKIATKRTKKTDGMRIEQRIFM